MISGRATSAMVWRGVAVANMSGLLRPQQACFSRSAGLWKSGMGGIFPTSASTQPAQPLTRKMLKKVPKGQRITRSHILPDEKFLLAMAKEDKLNVPSPKAAAAIVDELILSMAVSKLSDWRSRDETVLKLCDNQPAQLTALAQVLWQYSRDGGPLSVKLLETARRQGDLKAGMIHAEMYIKGFVLPQDLKEAAKIFEELAEKGDGRAQAALASIYVRQGIKERRAIKLFEQAVQNGVTNAYSDLAAIYADPKTMERDMGKAVEYVMKGVEHDDPESMLMLAGMYANGEGVEESQEQSLAYALQAAQLGLAPAQHAVATKYALGIGTRQDVEQAEAWYLLAVNQRYGLAIYNLGALYYATGRLDEARKTLTQLLDSESALRDDAQKLIKIIDADLANGAPGTPPPKPSSWCSIM
ncbi:hypothetical protein RI367_004674 [Sorochytrium milnesiophthora]